MKPEYLNQYGNKKKFSLRENRLIGQQVDVLSGPSTPEAFELTHEYTEPLSRLHKEIGDPNGTAIPLINEQYKKLPADQKPQYFKAARNWLNENRDGDSVVDITLTNDGTLEFHLVIRKAERPKAAAAFSDGSLDELIALAGKAPDRECLTNIIAKLLANGKICNLKEIVNFAKNLEASINKIPGFEGYRIPIGFLDPDIMLKVAIGAKYITREIADLLRSKGKEAHNCGQCKKIPCGCKERPRVGPRQPCSLEQLEALIHQQRQLLEELKRERSRVRDNWYRCSNPCQRRNKCELYRRLRCVGLKEATQRYWCLRREWEARYYAETGERMSWPMLLRMQRGERHPGRIEGQPDRIVVHDRGTSRVRFIYNQHTGNYVGSIPKEQALKELKLLAPNESLRYSQVDLYRDNNGGIAYQDGSVAPLSARRTGGVMSRIREWRGSRKSPTLAPKLTPEPDPFADEPSVLKRSSGEPTPATKDQEIVPYGQPTPAKAPETATSPTYSEKFDDNAVINIFDVLENEGLENEESYLIDNDNYYCRIKHNGVEFEILFTEIKEGRFTIGSVSIIGLSDTAVSENIRNQTTTAGLAKAIRDALEEEQTESDQEPTPARTPDGGQETSPEGAPSDEMEPPPDHTIDDKKPSRKPPNPANAGKASDTESNERSPEESEEEKKMPIVKLLKTASEELENSEDLSEETKKKVREMVGDFEQEHIEADYQDIEALGGEEYFKENDVDAKFVKKNQHHEIVFGNGYRIVLDASKPKSERVRFIPPEKPEDQDSGGGTGPDDSGDDGSQVDDPFSDPSLEVDPSEVPGETPGETLPGQPPGRTGPDTYVALMSTLSPVPPLGGARKKNAARFAPVKPKISLVPAEAVDLYEELRKKIEGLEDLSEKRKIAVDKLMQKPEFKKLFEREMVSLAGKIKDLVVPEDIEFDLSKLTIEYGLDPHEVKKIPFILKYDGVEIASFDVTPTPDSPVVKQTEKQQKDLKSIVERQTEAVNTITVLFEDMKKKFPHIDGYDIEVGISVDSHEETYGKTTYHLIISHGDAERGKKGRREVRFLFDPDHIFDFGEEGMSYEIQDIRDSNYEIVKDDPPFETFKDNPKPDIDGDGKPDIVNADALHKIAQNYFGHKKIEYVEHDPNQVDDLEKELIKYREAKGRREEAMRVLEEAPDLDDGSTTEDVIKRADKLLDVLRTLDDESVDEGYGPATSPNDAFSGSMPEGERTILKRIKASGLLEGKDNIAKEVDQRLTELGAIETEAGIYKKEYDSVSKHLIKKLTEAIAKLDSSMNTVKEMEGNWYDNINRFNARHLINSWKAFEAAYNHPLFGTQDENIYVDKFLPENSREMRNENKDIYDEFYKDDNRKKAIEQAEALMNPMAAVDKLKRQLADYDNTGAIRTLSYLGAVLRDGSVPGAERTELQELLEEGLEVDGYKVPFVMDANNRLLPNINVNELMGDPVDRALDRMEQYIKEKAEAINNSDATAGAQADAKIQHEFDYFTLFFDFLSPSEAAQKQYADGLKNLTIRYGDTKRACVICEYEPGADPTALRTINVAVDSAVDVTDYRAAIANGRKIDLDIGEWEKEDGAIKALDDELVEKVNATGDRRMLEDLSEDLNKITINGFAGGMKIKMKIEGGELKYEVTEAPSNQNNFKNAFKDRIDMLKAAYAAPRNEADIKKHKAWFKNMARFIESSAEAQQILIDNWEGTDEAKFSDGIFDYFVSVQSGEYREILDPNCLPEAARKMIRDLKDVIKTSHNLDDFRAYLDEIQRICGAAGAKLPNVESVFKAEKFKFEGEDMELVWATDHIEIKMTDQSKLEDSTRTKKKSIEAFMGDPEAKEVDIALVRKELLIYLEVAERLQGGSQKDKIKQVLAESHPVPAEGRAFRFTGDNLELEYCDISFIKDEYEINEVFDQVLFTAVKGVNFIRNGDHFKLWVDGAEFKNVPVVLQGFVSAISAAGGGKGVKLFRRQPDGTCFILDNINGKNLISVKERDEGGTKFVDIDLNFVVPSEHYELERN